MHHGTNVNRSEKGSTFPELFSTNTAGVTIYIYTTIYLLFVGKLQYLISSGAETDCFHEIPRWFDGMFQLGCMKSI